MSFSFQMIVSATRLQSTRLGPHPDVGAGTPSPRAQPGKAKARDSGVGSASEATRLTSRESSRVALWSEARATRTRPPLYRKHAISPRICFRSALASRSYT
jgi:hypothetical protein